VIGGWWAWVDQSEGDADDDEDDCGGDDDGEDEEEDFEGVEGGGGAGVEDLHFGVGAGWMDSQRFWVVGCVVEALGSCGLVVGVGWIASRRVCFDAGTTRRGGMNFIA